MLVYDFSLPIVTIFLIFIHFLTVIFKHDDILRLRTILFDGIFGDVLNETSLKLSSEIDERRPHLGE